MNENTETTTTTETAAGEQTYPESWEWDKRTMRVLYQREKWEELARNIMKAAMRAADVLKDVDNTKSTALMIELTGCAIMGSELRKSTNAFDNEHCKGLQEYGETLAEKLKNGLDDDEKN